MIRVRHVTDLMSKRKEAQPYDQPYGQTLAQLAPEDVRVAMLDSHLVTVNDDEWNARIPEQSTVCYITTYHSVGAVVAAIVAAAQFVATAVAAFAVSGFGQLVIGLGLSLAANKLLAPSAAGLPNFKQDSDDTSAAFGFDAIQNVVENGSVIGAVYGEHLVGGAIIAAWRTGDPEFNTILHVIFALGHGPIDRIGVGTNEYSTSTNDIEADSLPSGMLINGIPADTYEDIDAHVRMGEATETVMPGFEEVFTEYEQEFRLDEDTIEWTTKDAVNGVGFLVTFPGGLWDTDSRGKIGHKTLDLIVTVTELDGATIITTDVVRFRERRRYQIWASQRYDDLSEVDNGPGAQGPRRMIIKVKRDPSFLPPGYLSTGSKVKQDLCDLIAFHEIRYAAIAYNGVAKFGAHIRATGQLSGTIPTILTLMRGLKIEVGTAAVGSPPAFTTEYSANPAWIGRSILTNKVFGMGNVIASTDPDYDDFKLWSEYCDALVPEFTGSVDTEKRFVSAMVYDSQRQGWESLLLMTGISRALPLTVGDTINVKLENQRAVTQNFGAAEIEDDSFAFGFISPTERFTAIEARFRNAANEFEQDSIRVEIPGLDETLGDTRGNTTEAFGLVKDTIVKRLVSFWLRQERFTRGYFRFRCPLAAIAAEPGDVIGVSHRVQRWSVSGRTRGQQVDASDAYVKLDQSVVLETDVIYTYKERRKKDSTDLSTDFTVPAPVTVTDLIQIHAGFLTVVNYLNIGGDTISLSIDGAAPVVLTEGVEWTASVDNATTMGSIATAINALVGVSTLGSGVSRAIEVDEGSVLDLLVTSAAFADLNLDHESTGEIGASFILGHRSTITQQGVIMAITAGKKGTDRSIECLDYHPHVYTDDSEPLETGAFLVPQGDLPADVDWVQVTISNATTLFGSGVSLFLNINRTIYQFEEGANFTVVSGDEETTADNLKTAIEAADSDFVVTRVDEGGNAHVQINRASSVVRRSDFQLLEANGGWSVGFFTLVESASTKTNFSKFTLSWVAPEVGAGEAAPSAYQVWIRVDDEAWRRFGESTTSLSKVVEVRCHFNTVFEFAAQALTITGRRKPITSAPTFTYLTERIDFDAQVFAKVPANVQNFAIASSSGTTYNLTWDAVVNDKNGDALGVAVRYDVRVGGWTAGSTLIDTAGLSALINVNSLAQPIHIRAYTKPHAKHFIYSLEKTTVTTPVVAPTGFTVEHFDEYIDFEFPTAQVVVPDLGTGILQFDVPGEIQNADLIEWVWANNRIDGRALKQIDKNVKMIFVSRSINLGSAADTFISFALNIFTGYTFRIDQLDYNTSMDAYSRFGPVSGHRIPEERQMRWTLWIETSNDGITWTRQNDFANAMMDRRDLSCNAQYFRIRLEALGDRVDTPFDSRQDDDDLIGRQEQRIGRAILKELKMALHREVVV